MDRPIQRRGHRKGFIRHFTKRRQTHFQISDRVVGKCPESGRYEMKGFLDFFKKKTKPNYKIIKGSNGLPIFVLPLPDGVDLQKDETPEPQTIKEK